MAKAVSGIYVIANTKTGWVYIGQAQNIRQRWYEHTSSLNKNCHGNIYLQRAWNKCGKAAFKFQILEHCAIDQLTQREQHHISIYAAKGICYNIRKNAETPHRGSLNKGEVRIVWVRADHEFVAKLKTLAAIHSLPLSDYIRKCLDVTI
jgi:group I intron endonuclease